MLILGQFSRMGSKLKKALRVSKGEPIFFGTSLST